ncbi:MAG: CHASE domain-containing protein [Nibricoccus sp.]
MTATPNKSRRRRLLVLWLVALTGVALSSAGAWWLYVEEQGRTLHEFRRRTRSLVNVVQQVVASREEALTTLRELYHNSESVTRHEFSMAAEALIGRKPGLIALLWAPRVPASQRRSFEAAAFASGYNDFKIHRLDSGRRAPPTNSAETFPITYIAPGGIFPVEGLDLSTLSIWPELQSAAKSGAIRFAQPPGALTRDAREPSCLLAIPVYRDAVPQSENERSSALQGFVVGLLDPAVLLNRAVSRLPNQGLEVLLVERQKNGEVRPLHYTPAAGAAPIPDIPSIEAIAYDQHHQIAFELGDGNWELWTRPAPAWLTSQRTYREYIAGTSGLLFTGLLVFYLRSLFRNTEAVEIMVAKRTVELTETQDRLREDIQRRIKAELSLKASEERYRILISQSTEAVWLLEIQPPVPVDLAANVLIDRILRVARLAECNPAAAQLYGHSQPFAVIGRDLDYFAPQARSRHTAVLRAFVQSGYHLAEHEACDNQPGEPRVFHHNLIGVIEDDRLVRIWVTERELTQQRQIERERQALDRQLSETQRLESLGVLAGGIAHDFNNLLTSILGHASLGRAEIPSDSPLDEHFVEIETASRSAANLCQQMLAYAGKGRFVVKLQDLSQLIAQSAHLIQTSISHHCSVNFQLAENLPPVMADALQIQQIVMNLVLNASEAIGARGGQITLFTELVHPDSTTFNGCPCVPSPIADEYVSLTVQDSGAGMDATTLSRIFEPFFTTKFTGRGLGLPATLGIVRSHQGALRVDSHPGVGTSITLFLPTATPQVDEARKADTKTPWEPEGTLLFIDDEASVRGVGERMARALGFSALSAADGTQGIELFRHYQPSITAVLVDLSMPVLTGEETMQRLRAISPALPLICMSGYNQPNTLSVHGLAPFFLSKPFNITQFQSVVRQATKKRAAV